MSISVLGGDVLAQASSRVVARLRRQGEGRGFTRKQNHYQYQLLCYMYYLFMPTTLCQGPEPSYANHVGALSKQKGSP